MKLKTRAKHSHYPIGLKHVHVDGKRRLTNDMSEGSRAMLDDDDNDDVCDEGQRGLAKKHVHMDGKRRLTNDMSKGSRHASKFRERQQLLGFCCCVNCIITLGGVLTSLSLGGLLPAANSQLGRRPPLPASPSPHPSHPPPHSSPVPHLPRLPPTVVLTAPSCPSDAPSVRETVRDMVQSHEFRKPVAPLVHVQSLRRMQRLPGRSWEELAHAAKVAARAAARLSPAPGHV